MNQNQKIGAYGEKLVANYLVRKGYKILDKNYRASHKELDIIACKGDYLIFVEVKTRMTKEYDGLESMHDMKLEALNSAIQSYLTRNKAWDNEIRADLVLVLIDRDSKSAKVKHYEGIL